MWADAGCKDSFSCFFLCVLRGDSIGCETEENSVGISGISILDLGKLKRTSAVFFRKNGFVCGFLSSGV